MIGENILKMPKIDLHCHLDGSMTRTCIEEILGREVAPEEVQVAPECESLAEYLQKFDLPLECIQTTEGLRKAAKDFLLELPKDQVKYVEVRFAPQLSRHQGMNCKKVMEAVLDGLEEAKNSCDVEYQVIACMMSHHDEETNLRMLKECREFLGEGLCAVDLAGDEAGFPRKKFYPLFQEAKRMDYPFTIHSGECGNVQNVLMAVEWGAKRIGHGIAMMGNPQVQELLAKKHVGVELCPTSNYQTKALLPGTCYPVREFANAGVPVSINTDNRLVSNTSLANEMQFLREQFGITEEELRSYQRNAVETAFCDDSVKHKLWKLFK